MGEPGKSVRWLLIGLDERDDGGAFRLPCPATELIRLANVCCDGYSIQKLLRLNPALLLFALSNYRREHGQSPESAQQFLLWCNSGLIRAAGQSRLNSPVKEVLPAISRKKLDAFFASFLSARGNRSLRRTLSRFLVLFCGVGKSNSKKMVARLVGRQLRANQLKCQRVRNKATCRNVVGIWRRGIGPDVDVMGLFDLAITSLETNAQFAQRLHEEKLASMKQLAYGASHEINNPLANIATRAQTMLAVETEPEKRHKLSVIYEQAMRAHEMISDMMLFAHPPAISKKRVSIRLLISKLVHELEPVFDSTPDVEFGVTIGAGIDQANVDETQMSVAIKNLIQNSFEALRCTNERHKRIELRIDRPQTGDLLVSVWDNGMGISDEVARHMFDPFYSGREAGRGLGFGLSKVWAIAKLHGGDLRYDDQNKTGTCFVLQLPLEEIEITRLSAAAFSIRNNQKTDAEEEAA